MKVIAAVKAVRARLLKFAVLALFCAAGSLLFAQATSRVTGTVQDKTGGVVPGADVTLTNQSTNVSVNTTTTSAGTYVFDGIAPGTYTVSIQAAGFGTYTSKGNILTIAQPIVVNATLQIGTAAEKVDVFAGAELVQLENAGDLGQLIDQRAVETLPVVGSRGRSPLRLVELTPGVVDGGALNSGGADIEGAGVSVNGSRDRAWNLTLDGVDINETSAPGATFAPLRTNPDSIGGFRVITGSANAEYGVTSGGQVILETRPGTNEYHGKVFWFYQTPGLNANDPGNKENGLGRPQFVQHIPGFSVGGPIFKNKTFFFVNMQFLHASQDFTVNSLVLTQQARMGTFRYLKQQGACIGSTDSSCPHNDNASSSDAVVDPTGNPLPGLPIGTYNVGANDPAALGLDGSIQKFLALTPAPNNFRIGDGLNTAGFAFQAPQEERQVDFTVRIDHNFNSKNSIFGRWAHGHQNTVGDTANAGLQPFPGAPNVVNTNRQPRNLAISWRYTPNPRITNEVIAGMNRFIFNFVNPDSSFLNNPPFILSSDFTNDQNDDIFGVHLTSPLQNYVGNKRALTSLQLVDNLSYIRGSHAFKFGTNLRYQRHIDDRGSVGPYDAQPLLYFNPFFAPVDAAKFKISSDVNISTDLGTLKNGINDLLGRIGDIRQGFAAQDANQFAPPGTHLRDDFRMPEYDFYAQDSWKIRRNVTIDVGLRWEIKLSPRIGPNFLLHPDQPFTVDAAPSDNLTWVPGKLYKDAWKKFAPSIGIAWDPIGNGKQSIRADYRLAYDRFNTFVLSSGIFQSLPGETVGVTQSFFAPVNRPADPRVRVSDGIPVLVPSATGNTPLGLRQPIPFSTSSIATIDPNWTPPQVHEWSLSVQRQIGNDTVLEVAYVGKHAVHLLGGYDSNQAQFRNNGFLDAFKLVQAGGDSPLIDQLVANDQGYQGVLSQGASATGSQYLSGTCIQSDGSNPCSVSPYASQFGFGSVAAVAASLGSTTDSQGRSLPVAAGLSPSFFFKYPQFAGGFQVLDSGDWSWYHALQASYHGRFHGLQFQTNYTYSKSMDTRSYDPTFFDITVGGSSAFGSANTPFDIGRRALNYAPSDFDRTHVFQAIWTYQIPFGTARHWGANWGPALDRLVGGWEVSGVVVAESGLPSTIFSPAFTTSSIVRTPASCNGCSPTMPQVHFNPDTGGLNYFTTAQMNMFTTPGPGEFSNLGRNYFRLGHYNVMNLSLGKVTRITERQSFELRIEMQNALNSKHYGLPGSIRTNSGIFGVADAGTAGANSSPRTIQLSAKYSF
jgi:hypothetical protein